MFFFNFNISSLEQAKYIRKTCHVNEYVSFVSGITRRHSGHVTNRWERELRMITIKTRQYLKNKKDGFKNKNIYV